MNFEFYYEGLSFRDLSFIFCSM